MSGPAFQLSDSAPDTVCVSGALTFTSAAAALSAINASLARDGRRLLDLTGVKYSDSAGLACVLAALAQAQGRVRVRNVPAGMQVLAKVCEVDNLLS
ncbi:STAS domain-containing protein [Dyella tabacisoli]|uniref:STAS domain-containing protein n=1 Tax=Dyella tabacisoli TaxID=2282381 RepID=A0A369UN71_9GAMM|nr:STAS domain-containing protein [Dyella tabacisoli]RDD81927.1 STAS domain-containing protein [Dyella tabacisoli]